MDDPSMTLADLAQQCQAEAQESQHQMDQLVDQLDRGAVSRQRFDCGWYYWRGRRDALETIAYSLLHDEVEALTLF